jgi:hypothetical protein
MTIREAIVTILIGYGSGKSQAFCRYLVEASADQGQRAKSSMDRFFDRLNSAEITAEQIDNIGSLSGRC